MKLSLLQENLNTALNNVSRFVSPKSQLPILNNILFSTDNGRLRLTATNLDIGINFWIGAKIEEEGNFTIPSREITEFISYLSIGKLDLSLNNSLLLVNSSKAESTFTTIPASDFPEFPIVNKNSLIEIETNILIDAVSQIAFSAATDDTRPVLTSILCQFNGENLTLVATDGFRLSVKNIKISNPLNLEKVFLIPAKSLIEITKLSKTSSTIKIGLTSDQHQIAFVLEDLELFSRLIDGDYPDYKRIIPSSYTTKIFVNRDEFSQAVKIASVFARESANVVRFNFKKSDILISANAPQIGQNKTNIEAKIEGDQIEIAFNFKFLSDFLNICKGKELVIELNESLTPGLFYDISSPEFTHIIMPVRLQD